MTLQSYRDGTYGSAGRGSSDTSCHLCNWELSMGQHAEPKVLGERFCIRKGNYTSGICKTPSQQHSQEPNCLCTPDLWLKAFRALAARKIYPCWVKSKFSKTSFETVLVKISCGRITPRYSKRQLLVQLAKYLENLAKHAVHSAYSATPTGLVVSRKKQYNPDTSQ